MDSNVAFLASDVGRLFRRRFEMATRDLGVTGPSWRTLMHIMNNPGINQQSLATFLEVEPITTGRMIDRLEKQGLVERRQDPTDRRAWLLHLTEDGLALLEQLKARAAIVMQQSTDMFAPQELSQLVELLRRMREHLLDRCDQVLESDTNG